MTAPRRRSGARRADVRASRLALARLRELRQAAAHAVRAAVRAGRRRARVVPRAGHVADDRVDRARVHLRALRGDGIQSHRRSRDRRAESAHAPARDSERRAAAWPRPSAAVAIASALFVFAAWRLNPLCALALAARAGLGAVLQLHQAIHAVVSPRARRRHVDRAGRRLSRGDRRVERRRGGCSSRWRSPWRRGAAASTSCTRCRTSTFDREPATAIRFRRRSASAARCAIARGLHLGTVSVSRWSARRRSPARTPARSTRSASWSRPGCSCTSTRS